MVMGLMTYTCWESSFKAVVISQRAIFERGRLSLERKMGLHSFLSAQNVLWLPVSAETEVMLVPHHQICILALSVQYLWSCVEVHLEPYWFLLAFSFLTLSKLLHLLHQILSHRFAHTFSILLTSTSVHSALFVSSPLILFLLESMYHHLCRYLKDM